MAVKIVTSNGQTVQSFEDWKNGGKSPNGSQQAASYSGPQIVSSSGQTIQSFEEWRQNRTSGVTPGGDSVIIDWMDRYNRVMQGVSAYDKKRNGGFTRDASGGFGSEIDSLIADYDGIERYAADYGFRDAQKYLVQLKKLQNSIQGINDNFSQFEDEDAYNRYMDYWKDQEEKRNLDLDAYEREIKLLENAMGEYKNLSRWVQDDRGNARLDAIRQQYGSLDEMETLLSQKQRYLTQAKRVQKKDDFSAVANPESEKYDAAFDSKSGYVSTEQDGKLERLLSQYSMGYDDLTYEYINNQNGIRDTIKQKAGAYKKGETPFEAKGYDYMTEDEVGLYNYYYSMGGKASAEAYLDTIQEDLNQRKAAGMYQQMEGKTGAELVFGVEAGLDQFKGGIKGAVRAVKGDDSYVAPSATQYASGMVREDLADDGFKLPSWLGGASLGQVGYDAITTTANMAPSIAVGMLSRTLGTAALGVSAGGSAYQEALNEGYSVDQARGYGILSGASEIVMEKVLGGISAYGGNALGKFFTQNMKNADTALKRIAKELGGSMLSEFSEEYLQEVLTPVFKNLTLGTDEEVKLVSAEALYAGFLGAITGGIMEGPSAIAGSRNATQLANNSTPELSNATETAGKSTPLPGNATADNAAAVTEESSAVDDKLSATESTVGKIPGKDESSTAKVGVSKMETVQQTADIESFAEQFGTQAEAVRRNYMEGQDLQEYEVGFEAAYTMGRDGGKAESLNNSTLPGLKYLSQSQRDIAFSLGRDAAAAQKAAAPKKAAVTAKMTTEEGTQDVTIAEVVDMDDTTMTFRLEDGRTVTDNDLDFEKGQELMAAAWELGMDVKSVNTIVTESAANAAADADQAAGIQQAHHYGQHGYTMEQLTKYGADAAALTDGQRKAAWEAGRKIYLQKAAEPAPALKAPKTSGVWFDAGGGNIRSFDTADLSGLSEAAVAGARAAQVLQKLGIGKNYYFYESYVNKSGERVYKDENGQERKAPNGWYDKSTGSIHIDLNAGAEGKGLTMYTLSHELTHFVEKWSPKKYQALADFLVANYAKAGNVDAMVAEKQAELSAGRDSEVSYEDAYSEFIADSMEAMLSDGNVLEKLQELKKTDKSLFDKIKEFFDNLARKIREIYKDLTPDSLEGQTVLQMKDQIDQIQQLFAEALTEASENFQAPVRPEFNMAEATRMLDDYKGGHSNFPVAQGIVDAFVQEYKQEHPGRQFSDRRPSGQITKQDRVYLDAVNHGNLVAAQKIVDEAAKKAGYNSGIIYHGTPKFGFTWFDLDSMDDGISIFATSDKKIAESYSGETDRDTISDRELKNVDEMSDSELLKYVQRYIDPKYHLATDSQRSSLLKSHVEAFESIRQELIQIAEHNADGSAQGGLSQIYEIADILGEMAQTEDVSKLSALHEKFMYKMDSLFWHYPKVERLLHRVYKDAFASTTINFVSESVSQIYRNVTEIAKTDSLFVTNEENSAEYLPLNIAREQLKGRTENGIYGLYAKTDNVLELDANGVSWKMIDGKQIGRDGFVTTREVSQYAKDAGYNGVVIRNLIDSGGRTNYVEPSDIYILFDNTQVKSADPVTFDDTGNVIPLSERFNSGKNDIRYQDRSTGTSTRDLLAGAFEDLARSPAEMEFLQKYQENIGLLNEQEAKLQEIRTEIRELTFGKGPKYPKRLEKLQEEATKTANRIHIYDKKLLQLEAAKPLRDVLDREREKVRKATRQKGQEAMAEYREKRKESAAKKDAKRKIRKTVMELDKLLNRGDKKKNVKKGMEDFAAAALASAEILFADNISNEDMILNGIGTQVDAKENRLIEEVRALLQKRKDLYNLDAASQEMEDIVFTGESESYAQRMAESEKLDRKISEKMRQLKGVFERERNRLNEATVSGILEDLAKAYKSLGSSDALYIRAATDERVYQYLTQLKDTIGGTTVQDMSASQLKALSDAYTMVLTTIRNANKAFTDGRSIQAEAEQMAAEFRSRKIPEKALGIAAKKVMDSIGWNYEKLHYALDRIGSPALSRLFNNLADSENITMRDVQEAKAYQKEMVEKYHYNDWKIDQKIDHPFVDNTGKEFHLTLGELMALYAYSRRDGADRHIEYGGFKLGKSALTDPKPATTYKLTAEQLAKITEMLTEEQRTFAEGMQKYLSETMGAKGNEVSMKLYGIEMFKEENYFPLHIAGEFKAQAQESQAKAAAGFQTMSNAGFTQTRNKESTAPIVLEDFMSVWADHVNEMARYHGAVPALEDIRRVMNYSVYSDADSESMSVEAAMTNAFGKQAVQYFDNLYREANSGAITDKLDAAPKKMLSLFRKNAVAYSVSVWIQQPASIYRARMMVDRKYFGRHGFFTLTGGVLRILNRKKWNTTYEEMMRYAPGVTMAKEIGGFDTSTGSSIRSYLMDTEKSFSQSMKNGTAKDKAKSVLKLVDDNAIANLPNVMDKVAWIEMWEACKRETVARNPQMETDSKAFLEKVGHRFTEVIRGTQVYDSMFAKSPMLKTNNLFIQSAVSFMNEPNTVANMAEATIRDLARGNKKQAAKTASALVTSIVANELLRSIVYAMRDDDEDETLLEKYISAVAGSLIDDVTVFNYVPYARDVWSVRQGYDAERADMAIVSDAVSAVKKLSQLSGEDAAAMTEEELLKWSEEVTDARWAVAETLSPLFGIPLKNIRRDMLAVFNAVKIRGLDKERQSTALSIRHTVEDAIWQGSKSGADRLYEAMVAGDDAYVQRLRNNYKSDDAYHTAIKKALRDNDSRIWEAAVAWNTGDMETYIRIAKEIRGENRFDQDDIVLAIRAEANSMEESQGESASTVKGYFTSEKFGVALGQNNTSMADIIRKDLIDTKVANGKTREEATSSVESTARSQLKELFGAGSITGAAAEKLLVRYGGYDQETSSGKVAEWQFEKDHPELDGRITYSQYKRWEADGKSRGVALDTFTDVAEYQDSGTSGSNRSQAEVADYINRLPISTSQKDALWCCFWKESTLYKAPWH